MKKVLAFILVLSLAVVTVFAGGSKESEEDGITLTLWGSSQTMVDFYEETVIPAFIEKYPEVKDVEVLYMPIEDFVQRLAVVLPAGEVPDIMEIEDSWATPYVTAGYFEPNTPELNAIVDQVYRYEDFGKLKL